MQNIRATILLAEDDYPLASIMTDALEDEGYKVIHCADGQEAIDKFDKSKIDICLLDIMMPEISGLDILRQMRQDPALANIPVVVVSAKSMPADIRNGMEAGASTYLTKPVGFLELKEAVERALGSQSPAT